MWVLSLDLKIGKPERGIVAMDSKNRETLKATYTEIVNKGRSDKSVTRECLAVLNDIIRPAIRQVAEDIPHKDVSSDPNDQKPWIRVEWKHDELRFICRGDVVEIVTTINDRSSNDLVSTRDISEELIVEQIERFFRRSYNLSSRLSS